MQESAGGRYSPVELHGRRQKGRRPGRSVLHARRATPFPARLARTRRNGSGAGTGRGDRTRRRRLGHRTGRRPALILPPLQGPGLGGARLEVRDPLRRRSTIVGRDGGKITHGVHAGIIQQGRPAAHCAGRSAAMRAVHCHIAATWDPARRDAESPLLG